MQHIQLFVKVVSFDNDLEWFKKMVDFPTSIVLFVVIELVTNPGKLPWIV